MTAKQLGEFGSWSEFAQLFYACACPAQAAAPAAETSVSPAESFPQRGNCGLALPVAEEARPQLPQRSKNARKSETRSIFREPQGGQAAVAVPRKAAVG